jgi:hypothetical protein
MLQIVKDNPEGHFFLDEVPLAELRITPEDLEEISNAIPEENLFWFACQSQLSPLLQEQELKDCGKALVQQFPTYFVTTNNEVKIL